MKSRILGFIIMMFCGGALTLMTFGQRGGPPPQLPRYLPSDKKFDPHDLAGVWTRNSSRLGYGGGGKGPGCGGRGLRNNKAPLSPFGPKKFYVEQTSSRRNHRPPAAPPAPAEHNRPGRALPP